MSTLSAELPSFTDQLGEMEMPLNGTFVERKISHIWKVLQVGAKFFIIVASVRDVTFGILD
jgi:hypothetical protein